MVTFTIVPPLHYYNQDSSGGFHRALDTRSVYNLVVKSYRHPLCRLMMVYTAPYYGDILGVWWSKSKNNPFECMRCIWRDNKASQTTMGATAGVYKRHYSNKHGCKFYFQHSPPVPLSAIHQRSFSESGRYLKTKPNFFSVKFSIFYGLLMQWTRHQSPCHPPDQGFSSYIYCQIAIQQKLSGEECPWQISIRETEKQEKALLGFISNSIKQINLYEDYVHDKSMVSQERLCKYVALLLYSTAVTACSIAQSCMNGTAGCKGKQSTSLLSDISKSLII